MSEHYMYVMSIQNSLEEKYNQIMHLHNKNIYKLGKENWMKFNLTLYG